MFQLQNRNEGLGLACAPDGGPQPTEPGPWELG